MAMVGPRFAFADGSRLSPEEYGYTAVRIGSQSAVEQVDACFGQDTFGASLGLAKAVGKGRFAADVYTTMLHVGIYLWYAASVLKVNAALVERISKGIRDGLGDLRTPNGRPLENDFKEFLLQQAYGFAAAVADDVGEMSTLPTGAMRPHSLPSTALLLNILHRGNSDDPAILKEWEAELLAPAGIWLRHIIEASTLAGMQVMSKALRISFEA